jgi:hypothetical protein
VGPGISSPRAATKGVCLLCPPPSSPIHHPSPQALARFLDLALLPALLCYQTAHLVIATVGGRLPARGPLVTVAVASCLLLPPSRPCPRPLSTPLVRFSRSFTPPVSLRDRLLQHKESWDDARLACRSRSFPHSLSEPLPPPCHSTADMIASILAHILASPDPHLLPTHQAHALSSIMPRPSSETARALPGGPSVTPGNSRSPSRQLAHPFRAAVSPLP